MRWPRKAKLSQSDARRGPTLTAAIITLDEEHNLAELLASARLGRRDRGGRRRLARRDHRDLPDGTVPGWCLGRSTTLHDNETTRWIWPPATGSCRSTRTNVPRRVWRPKSEAALPTSRHAAYRVPIRSAIFGRPLRRSGTQDDRPVRLLRRDSARWGGDVHERPRVAGRIGQLENWLTHRTQSTLHEFLSKMHRYTTLDARASESPQAVHRVVATAGRPRPEKSSAG